MTGAAVEPPVQDGARATTCPSCSGRATLEILQVETPAGRLRRYVVRCWNHDQRPGQRCDWTVTDRPLDDAEPPAFPGPPARGVDPPAPILSVTAACASVRRCPVCKRRVRKPNQKNCSRQCSLDAQRLARAQRKAGC